MAARVPVLALVCLALAACAGESSTRTAPVAPEAAVVHAQVVRWSGGLRRWGSDIQSALDGISVLFSRQAALDAIESRRSLTHAALVRYERTLTGCTATVRRLGVPPAGFAVARRDALRACVSLEKGAQLVQKTVREIERGLTPDLLTVAGDSLGAGEDGVRRALLDLGE